MIKMPAVLTFPPAPPDPLDVSALNDLLRNEFPTLAYPVRYREPSDANQPGVFLDDIDARLRSLGYRNFRLVWDGSGYVQLCELTPGCASFSPLAGAEGEK